MATQLSKAALEMLEKAGFTEVSDDFVVHGQTDIRILLCRRAVEDLNAQAREGLENDSGR
ncbi:hypothetical protein ABIC83_002535 [Roseateles asaccharophilus]|uniref:hypothetical protein n=1 Tax=Roseateles asaccharophilus TaxID=582607 RepID=UPI0038399B4C